MHRVLRWEDPPAPVAGLPRGVPRTFACRWRDVSDSLRYRPGQWAVIYEGTQAMASHHAIRINDGRGSFAPAGVFEAVTRKVGPSQTRVVYARYLGRSSRTGGGAGHG